MPISPTNVLIYPRQSATGQWNDARKSVAQLVQRFQALRNITTGLFTKENNVQVNNLTNAMGSCADEILTTLRVDEAIIEYKELIKQIEYFFKVRRNILAERQKFNKRIQGRKDDSRTVEETIETFINVLYTLAETCNYGMMNSSVIESLQG